MTKRLLVLVALLCGYATAQYIPVVATSCIKDASGSLIASGTFTVQATDDQNRPLAFRIDTTTGQAITAPVVWTITTGTLSAGAGTLQLADPAQTQPLNIKYHFAIKNLATGNITNYSLITISINDGAGHFDFCRMNPYLTGTALSNAINGPAGPIGPTGLQGIPGSGAFSPSAIVDPWYDYRSFGSGDVCQHVAAVAATIQASAAPGGVIDARAATGAQSCSVAPFAGINKPITLITGPSVWSWNISSFNFELPPHLHLFSQGTTFRNSVNGAGGATLTIMGRVMNTGGLFIPRVYSTTGSITSGTNTLTVASTTGIEPGTVVAVWGAQGGTTQQTTTISNGGSSITAIATSVPLASMSGLPNTTLMVFQIDSELLKCTTATTGTTMTACTRGYAGTTAAVHADGATVKDVLLFITDVLSVSGSTLTLLDNASFTVANADVAYGSTGIILDGDLTIDGNQNRATGPSNGITVSGLNAIFASNMYVAPSVTFYNNNHGGAMINCSRHNYIFGQYKSNGRPAAGLGADVWLLEQSSYNTVATAFHSDGDYAVLIDDRSDSSNLCDGSSSNNSVKVGPVLGTYVFGVGIEGGNNNRVDIGSLNASNTGAYITSAQWTLNPTPTRNLITFAMLNGTIAGVSSSGYTGGNNAFIGGATTGGANTFVAGDSFLGGGAIVSTLDGMKLFRSGGNAGFPDVFALGTLVLGGNSDGSGQVSAGATSDFLVPKVKSTTGARYVCVDTSGKLVSQAAACSGT